MAIQLHEFYYLFFWIATRSLDLDNPFSILIRWNKLQSEETNCVNRSNKLHSHGTSSVNRGNELQLQSERTDCLIRRYELTICGNRLRYLIHMSNLSTISDTDSLQLRQRSRLVTQEIDLLNISFTVVKYVFVFADFYVAGELPCGHFIMITYEFKVKTRREWVQTPMLLCSFGRRWKGNKTTHSWQRALKRLWTRTVWCLYLSRWRLHTRCNRN